MEDRRHTARRRALSTARLSWPAGIEALDAVLRDVSGRGAMLLVDAPASLPCDIDVATAEEGSRRARVVWRGTMAVGIAFAAPAVHDPAPPPRPEARVVSLAAARQARAAPSDAERLASRIAAVLRRSERPRPDWL
jgi:hypothetical protein